MLCETFRVVQKLLKEDRHNGLLNRLILRDSARVEMLPERPPIIPPSLSVRDQAKDPVVSRA